MQKIYILSFFLLLITFNVSYSKKTTKGSSKSDIEVDYDPELTKFSDDKDVVLNMDPKELESIV